MIATPRQRFFHFSYLRPPATAGPRLHELRDGDAFAELTPVLFALGFKYAGLLLNYPPDPGSAIALPRLGPQDLVVLTTRPPINDPHSEGERRRIAHSGSPLEKAILQAAGDFFAVCKRPMVQLSGEIAEQLPPDVADRERMEFRVYRPIPAYIRYRSLAAATREARRYHPPADPNATAAFLVRTPLWPRGPTLLNAFGMDGVMTLIWCHLLRTRFPELLEQRGLTMAEITTQPLPLRPASLSFTEGWQVRLLLVGARPWADSSSSAPTIRV